MNFNLILTITTSLILTYFSIILITKLHNITKHFIDLRIKQHKQKNKNVPKKTKELQKKYLKKCLITLCCWLLLFTAIFIIGGSITPYDIREMILVKIASYGLAGLLISIILLTTYNWVLIFYIWLMCTLLAIIPIIGFLPTMIMALCFSFILPKIFIIEKNNTEFKKVTQNSKIIQYLQKLSKEYSDD